MIGQLSQEVGCLSFGAQFFEEGTPGCVKESMNFCIDPSVPSSKLMRLLVPSRMPSTQARTSGGFRQRAAILFLLHLNLEDFHARRPRRHEYTTDPSGPGIRTAIQLTFDMSGRPGWKQALVCPLDGEVRRHGAPARKDCISALTNALCVSGPMCPAPSTSRSRHGGNASQSTSAISLVTRRVREPRSINVRALTPPKDSCAVVDWQPASHSWRFGGSWLATMRCRSVGVEAHDPSPLK